MRMLRALAFSILLAGAAGIARDAGATVTISLVWETCTSCNSGVGTSTLLVVPGSQTARLGIFLTHDDPDRLVIHAFSLQFDADLANELNVDTGMANTNEWTGTDTHPGAFFAPYSPFSTGFQGFIESTGASAGRVSSFESATNYQGLPANGQPYSSGSDSGTAPQTYRVGFATFVINGAVTDGVDIFSGAFVAADSIYDGLGNNLVLAGEVQFGTATVNLGDPIPEPGTFALIGLGLAGLALARRCKPGV